MATGKGTGMMERILGSLMGLSSEESILLLPRWMEGADPRRKVAIFTAWMNSEKDMRLKRTLFVAWMAAERSNEKFLKDICVKASAVYVTKGFARADASKIEGWMTKVFERDMTLAPGVVANMAKNNFHMPEAMLLFLKKLARKVKERIRLRRRKNSDVTAPRCRSSATERLLAEGAYSLNLPLAETDRAGHSVVQPLLPGVLAEPPSLDSRRRIEDYETLIAPYRPLLAEVASMEILDELLRLLYEGGDVPSVVGWPGKMSDCEYRNLREHKHFLEILQGVSVYDHTYNALKAALDVAQEELRQRHDFLLPAIITAALAHDIGKIESLWGSSPGRKHTHEYVGEVKVEEMLASHGNEVFTETVVAAVSLHHTLSKDNTIAKIIMDADARARKYEITSADPAFTIKPMTEWLDLPRFAEITLPHINELVVKNRRTVWDAMSFDGIVYCTPDYVRDILKVLSFEKKVLDYRLLRQSFKMDNRAVLTEFSAILRKHGHLAYDINEAYFGLKFLFQSSVPDMRQPELWAIPVKIGLFPAKPSKIEERKTDYLKTIVSVRPVAGGA
ncbi:MAG: HD domain-containing protein [Syntrophorhabdales bacterium]